MLTSLSLCPFNHLTTITCHTNCINPNHSTTVFRQLRTQAAFAATPMLPCASRSPSQVTSRYFSGGDHNGIGGGSKNPMYAAASNTTLFFVLSEMCRRNLHLAFDTPGPGDDIILPTQYPESETEYDPPKHDWIYNFTKMISSTAPRNIPSVDEVHWMACRRMHELPNWRPGAVEKIEDKLMKFDWRLLMKTEGEDTDK